MANCKQALKRIRQNEKRTARNKSRMSRVRTFLRNLNDVIEAKDKAKATELFRQTSSELHKGVQKNVLHKKTVARKLSRLSAKIKAIS